MRRLQLLYPEAEPVHAGVDFQPDCEALRPCVLLQHRDLLERMNHELQIVPGCNLELTCAEDAFEHYDRTRDTRGSQCQSFLDTRDSKRIRAGKCARGVDEPVPVGVGFDGRDYARARCEAANYPEVVTQSRCIDGDERSAGHTSP